MIDIDFDNKNYVCPYCGNSQSFTDKYYQKKLAFYSQKILFGGKEVKAEKELEIYLLKCGNPHCKMFSATSFDTVTKEQFDIFPERVYKKFSEYIPKQIR